MRVLLLCPPSSFTPPGAPPRHAPHVTAIVAAALQEAGHDPVVRDHHLGDPSLERICQVSSALQPDCILLMAADDNRRAPSEVLGLVAERLGSGLPGVPLYAFGRVHAARAQQLMEAAPQVPGFLFGEPDQTVGELADALSSGGVPCDVANLVTREPGGALCTSGPSEEPLDHAPTPAWDLLEMGRYPFSPHQETADRLYPVLASRGCPWSCFFCEVQDQPPWVARPVADIMGELADLRTRHGAKSVFFADANFLVDESWTRGLCEALLEHEPQLRWSCMLRTDRCTPELLQLMARSGCGSVLFGVESFEPSALRASNKKLDVMTAGPAITAAKEAGMEVIVSLMIGLPGDTPEGVHRTVDRLIQLEPDFAQFFLVQVAHDEAPEGGRFLSDWEGAKHDFWGRLYAPESFRTRAQLEALQRQAYRRFYLRPRYIFKKVTGLLNSENRSHELARMVRGALLASRLALSKGRTGSNGAEAN